VSAVALDCAVLTAQASVIMFIRIIWYTTNLPVQNVGKTKILLDPLKPKRKNSVRTSKRTPHFTITEINWLMLLKEIIAVYTENHTKHINTKRRVTDGQSRWYIELPLGLKW
jgi:hypothetical protein